MAQTTEPALAGAPPRPEPEPAAHAADGWARVSGVAGCAVVTAGPGTTDAVTGVANAFRAESSMLLIGGQGALSQHTMGSLQDLPHVEIMAPITKFAATVPHTSRIADMTAMAFRRLRDRPRPRRVRSGQLHGDQDDLDQPAVSGSPQRLGRRRPR